MPKVGQLTWVGQQPASPAPKISWDGNSSLAGSSDALLIVFFPSISSEFLYHSSHPLPLVLSPLHVPSSEQQWETPFPFNTGHTWFAQLFLVYFSPKPRWCLPVPSSYMFQLQGLGWERMLPQNPVPGKGIGLGTVPSATPGWRALSAVLEGLWQVLNPQKRVQAGL